MSNLLRQDICMMPGLSAFERQFGQFMQTRHLKLDGGSIEDANLLGGLASLLASTAARGHVCLLLDERETPPIGHPPVQVTLPQDLVARLQSCSGNCLSIADSGNETPLMLALGARPRLYLHRHYTYERQLESAIRSRLNQRRSIDTARTVDPLFTDEERGGRQHEAACKAVSQTLTLVAGGPGTGKTTVALRILASCLNLEAGLRIGLAAPTGKAAARMSESILANLERLDPLEADIRRKIGDLRGSTLHRLLGYRPGSPYFRHNRDNPLPLDLLIIDEASMIDLPMMAKLFEALSPETRLVLLGDPNQLPSVEVGSVFGDMLEAPDLSEAITVLDKNYRAESASILEFCRAILDAEASCTPVLDLLKQGSPALNWHPVSRPDELRPLIATARDAYQELLRPAQDGQSLAALSEFRILTALRDGPYGASGLNFQIEAGLKGQQRLILVTSNDSAMDLFNGDIGIVFEPVDGSAKVLFPGRQPISLMRVPPHEPAYAMTGHRAQGSEFNHVHILLPDAENSPLLTRQWLYTAVSRARRSVTLWASEAAIRACLTRRCQRLSGLLRD